MNISCDVGLLWWESEGRRQTWVFRVSLWIEILNPVTIACSQRGQPLPDSECCIEVGGRDWVLEIWILRRVPRTGWLLYFQCTVLSSLPSIPRLLEEGNIEEAEVQKQRIEKLQRERRRVLEENGVEHQPRFFRKSSDDAWVSNGTYLELRKDLGFSKLDHPVLWWNVKEKEISCNFAHICFRKQRTAVCMFKR